MNTFDKQVCLVTGGGSGIGRATALAFAREGGLVAVADVTEAAGLETVRLIQAEGGEAIFLQADTSDGAQVAAMVRDTVAAFGRLDVAVNNAGVGGKKRAPIHEYDEEDWHRILSVNLTGVWYCLKHEVAQMIEQGSGRIVNLASVAGLKGFPNQTAYAATKHGVVGLTKSVALETATSGIRVNAVCPGYIETPLLMEGNIQAGSNPKVYEYLSNLTAMKRLGTPEEVAAAILWLCSDASSYVTGHCMAVEGGVVC